MKELLLLKERSGGKVICYLQNSNREHKFEASKAWFTRMCRKNNLVHCQVMNVGQKIPKNVVEIAKEFI